MPPPAGSAGEDAPRAETLPGGVGRLLRSRGAQVGLSLLLAAGLLYFFLSRVQFEPLARAIGAASAPWLLLGIAISLTTFAMRAIRWMALLRPVGRVPFLPAFLATALGFAGNNLPAKAGEVIRPAALARARRLPFSALLASILFERALDGASVVLFFLIAVLLGFPGAVVGQAAFARLRTAAWIGAGVFAALIGLAFLLLVRRDLTERLFERLAPRLPERWRDRARSALVSFPEGFASLADPRLFASVAAQSILMWLVINVQVYTVLRAFGIVLPFAASFVVTCAAVLGLAVPTPGGIGSYQAALQYTLTRFFGVPLGPASGFAVIAWAISFVPITLIGLAGLGTPVLRAPSSGVGGRESTDGRR
jgi:uncharacterized protein (TIRG00374 family)